MAAPARRCVFEPSSKRQKRVPEPRRTISGGSRMPSIDGREFFRRLSHASEIGLLAAEKVDRHLEEYKTRNTWRKRFIDNPLSGDGPAGIPPLFWLGAVCAFLVWSLVFVQPFYIAILLAVSSVGFGGGYAVALKKTDEYLEQLRNYGRLKNFETLQVFIFLQQVQKGPEALLEYLQKEEERNPSMKKTDWDSRLNELEAWCSLHRLAFTASSYHYFQDKTNEEARQDCHAETLRDVVANAEISGYFTQSLT